MVNDVFAGRFEGSAPQEVTDMEPTVHVFALGGTIAMTSSDTDHGVEPALDARALLDGVPGIDRVARIEIGLDHLGRYRDTFVPVSGRPPIPGAHLRLGDLVALASHLEDILAAGGADGRTPRFTPGTGKHRNPVHRGRKVLAIASPAGLVAAAVAAAICLAPVATAKRAEGGQVCTGPEMVAGACHPSPESWRPPGPAPSVCPTTGPTTVACGRRTARLAREELARESSPGTGQPTNPAGRDGAGGARKR